MSTWLIARQSMREAAGVNETFGGPAAGGTSDKCAGPGSFRPPDISGMQTEKRPNRTIRPVIFLLYMHHKLCINNNLGNYNHLPR